MKVRIRSLQGRDEVVEVGDSATVDDLHRAIETAFNMPPLSQRLIFRGAALTNGSAELKSLGIEEGMTVHMAERPPQLEASALPSAPAANGRPQPGGVPNVRIAAGGVPMSPYVQGAIPVVRSGATVNGQDFSQFMQNVMRGVAGAMQNMTPVQNNVENPNMQVQNMNPSVAGAPAADSPSPSATETVPQAPENTQNAAPQAGFPAMPVVQIPVSSNGIPGFHPMPIMVPNSGAPGIVAQGGQQNGPFAGGMPANIRVQASIAPLHPGQMPMVGTHPGQNAGGRPMNMSQNVSTTSLDELILRVRGSCSIWQRGDSLPSLAPGMAALTSSELRSDTVAAFGALLLEAVQIERRVTARFTHCLYRLRMQKFLAPIAAREQLQRDLWEIHPAISEAWHLLAQLMSVCSLQRLGVPVNTNRFDPRVLVEALSRLSYAEMAIRERPLGPLPAIVGTPVRNNVFPAPCTGLEDVAVELTAITSVLRELRPRLQFLAQLLENHSRLETDSRRYMVQRSLLSLGMLAHELGMLLAAGSNVLSTVRLGSSIGDARPIDRVAVNASVGEVSNVVFQSIQDIVRESSLLPTDISSSSSVRVWMRDRAEESRLMGEITRASVNLPSAAAEFPTPAMSSSSTASTTVVPDGVPRVSSPAPEVDDDFDLPSPPSPAELSPPDSPRLESPPSPVLSAANSSRTVSGPASSVATPVVGADTSIPQAWRDQVARDRTNMNRYRGEYSNAYKSGVATKPKIGFSNMQ